MYRLEPAFRRRLIELSASQGFAKGESTMRSLLLRRHTDGGASQEVWHTPQSVFVADDAPLGFAVSIWTYIVFPSIESTISEAIRQSGTDPDITDHRSARFSLNCILGENDHTCLQGLLVHQEQTQRAQAEAVWGFYWDRACTHLNRLSSPNILSELNYLPPSTSRVAWSTRQLLYHANRGQFELSQSIARGIEMAAATELLAPMKALIERAFEKGHEFGPAPHALDYTHHPYWLEFEAVRRHTTHIA
jgi:hypothetical protein